MTKKELLKKCEHLKDEDLRIVSKVLDQFTIASKRGYPTYTDYLDPHKIGILKTLLKQEDVSMKLFGGHEDAERCYLCFYKDWYSDIDKEHVVIKITPKLNRFTKNKISHRDYLGSILGLGLKRQKIGDILIDEEQNAYVFVKEDIGDYIQLYLQTVGRISVVTEILEDTSLHLPKPSYKEVNGTVPSLRLDAIISRGFNLSRSEAMGYIKGGKVSVNYVNIESSSHLVHEGDRIRVRGLGKSKVYEVGHETKKGRIHVIIHRYG